MSNETERRKRFFKKLQNLMKDHNCSIFINQARINFCFHAQEQELVTLQDSLLFDTDVAMEIQGLSKSGDKP
tara:strand:- start:363 stop:578 length:216 start_codon:yes stop_codon:yes gene_type:complete